MFGKAVCFDAMTIPLQLRGTNWTRGCVPAIFGDGPVARPQADTLFPRCSRVTGLVQPLLFVSLNRGDIWMVVKMGAPLEGQ